MAKPILVNGMGSPQDTHAVSTTQNHELGTAGYARDGRVWYYSSHVGAGLTRGELSVSSAIVANHQNLATATNALAVGATTIPSGNITLGATALTANQYAEGYLLVVDGGGEGTYYKIREHDAGTSAGTDFTIELYDPIQVASDANTEVSFVKNNYDSVIQSPTATYNPYVGVANVTVPAGSTTTQYFWAQTQGYCGAFVVGTPAVGTPLMRSDTTAGQLEARASTDEEDAIAQMVTVGITGEVQGVNLKIRGL